MAPHRPRSRRRPPGTPGRGKTNDAKRTGRRIGGTAGFTLVELTVAFLIACLAVSSLGLVFLGINERRTRQEERITARFLAQEGLERWIASGGGSTDSGSETEKAVSGYPAYSREIQWVTLPELDTRKATIEVESEGVSVRLQTMLESEDGT